MLYRFCRHQGEVVVKTRKTGLRVVLSLSAVLLSACYEGEIASISKASEQAEKIKELEGKNAELSKEKKANDDALKTLQAERDQLKADHEKLRSDCPGTQCHDEKKTLEAKISKLNEEIEILKKQTTTNAGSNSNTTASTKTETVVPIVDKLPGDFIGTVTKLELQTSWDLDTNSNYHVQTLSVKLTFPNRNGSGYLGTLIGIGQANLFDLTNQFENDKNVFSLDTPGDRPSASAPDLQRHPIRFDKKNLVEKELSPIANKSVSPMVAQIDSEAFTLKEKMTFKINHGVNDGAPLIISKPQGCLLYVCIKSAEYACFSGDSLRIYIW